MKKYFVEDINVAKAIKDAEEFLKNNNFVNIQGEKGCGKKSVAEHIAVKKNLNFVKIDCNNKKEFDEKIAIENVELLMFYNIQSLNIQQVEDIIAVLSQKEKKIVLINYSDIITKDHKFNELQKNNKIMLPALKERSDLYDMFCYFVEEFYQIQTVETSVIEILPNVKTIIENTIDWSKEDLTIGTLEDIAAVCVLLCGHNPCIDANNNIFPRPDKCNSFQLQYLKKSGNILRRGLYK